MQTNEQIKIIEHQRKYSKEKIHFYSLIQNNQLLDSLLSNYSYFPLFGLI
jgi:hypothetical protein